MDTPGISTTGPRTGLQVEDALGSLAAAGSAIFLDFDGTLAEIAPTPEAVFVPERVKDALSGLSALTNGALAIVSGREIATLDEFLAPLVFPSAGVHGLERRDARGTMFRGEPAAAVVAHITAAAEQFAATRPGVMVEHKRASVALHYRLRPQREIEVRLFAAELASRSSDVRIIHGKMVVEIVSRGHDKGQAIGAFMQEAPFAGRCPIFIGDDTTDEDAFPDINRMGGVSIKVGEGQTTARLRAENVGAVHRLLGTLLERWSQGHAKGRPEEQLEDAGGSDRQKGT